MKISIKAIKDMLKTSPGLELVEYLEGELSKLDRISNLENLNNELEIAIEVKAARKAHATITGILERLGIVKGAIEPSPGNKGEDVGL